MISMYVYFAAVFAIVYLQIFESYTDARIWACCTVALGACTWEALYGVD